MTRLSEELSTHAFEVLTEDDCRAWLHDLDRAVGGLTWQPVGAIPNNVHAVEVASDPAAAIVERVTNAIDAVLDLAALEHAQTAPSPVSAAHEWYGVPVGGVSEMNVRNRQGLADLIRVSNHESGVADRPTIVVQDQGTGQHPDRFAATHLSLMASNKKTKRHQMGVYNAGGAATYAFGPYTIIVSRCAPALLDGQPDEIGLAVVRYNPLDPDRYKSGTYEYCAGLDGEILRLTMPAGELPHLPFGTYVKHIAYELAAYARGAQEPKRSLHHLFHAALPDPALPFWIEERRVTRFPGVRGTGERRVVSGLVARLKGSGTADYNDERVINLDPDSGRVTLRYFVLNAGEDPDAFTTPSQGLALVLNGQRQGMRDRYWVKRNTGLNYLWRRLVILVDGNDLTNAAKREVFASTREASKDSPLSRRILERAKEELAGDEELIALDEEARQRTLSDATRSTSERVKRQLQSKVAAFLRGSGAGHRGGARPPTTRPSPTTPRGPRQPRNTDDSAMLDIPDTLELYQDSVRIEPGRPAALLLHINAKNGFLPRFADALTVVIGPELNESVRLRSKGRLVGGRVRLTLEADPDAPPLVSSVQVALVDPSLPLFLIAKGKVEVAEPSTAKGRTSENLGGAPDIKIDWIPRSGWDNQTPPWDEQIVGECDLEHKDPSDPLAITRAEWRLNEAFKPYEDVVIAKKLGEGTLKTFEDGYALPVCWGLFTQAIAEWEKERQADERGEQVEVPDDYVRGERARLARAVLMAMEPGLATAIEGEG